ncbi:dTDP-4-dehydrorhamnose 3,5-epimerase family protein [Amycolatopsis sp. NPDC059090]|uniref:dTDP-4-dehydrorhamnose 3,5-epimerase family protein n=1 Tax=unclassified Amycolatopsis TaxID=2618356 RepID=UPI00366ED22E
MESRTDPLPIAGAWKVVPGSFDDDRGSLHELFHSGLFGAGTGMSWSVQQAICSISRRSVLRGIRVTTVDGPAKLVSCLRGEVLDVVVDLRLGSPTFGRFHIEHLNEDNRTALYIAPGLGHAFLSLAERSTVLYLLSRPHREGDEHPVHPLDPALAIPWPSDVMPMLSAKDAAAPTASHARAAGLLPDYGECLPLNGSGPAHAS